MLIAQPIRWKIKQLRWKLRDIYYSCFFPTVRRIKRSICRHEYEEQNIVVDSTLVAEATYFCPKCCKRYTTKVYVYDWFTDEKPSNLWEAIHWNKIEAVPMLYERLRLRSRGHYELADMLRNKLAGWGYSVADYKIGQEDRSIAVQDGKTKYKPINTINYNLDMARCLQEPWQLEPEMR